ncbi:MAG TPA: glycosyltransferase family 2 protein, partial [Gemmataceae bacterium]|nr:glycosyltransferase family 2 protein [Gemmataceae bacterium]
MNVVAVAMVKDEADIVEAFVRHTLAHVNRLVVLENGSSDGSLEILRALEKERLPITILEDPTPGKYHSERMTRLMREHAVERHAADWVLPLDVDEFLAVSAGATLVSGRTNVDAPLALAWQTYVPDDRDDPLQLNPVLRMSCHLVHGCKAVNVLVPRKLAA